MGSRVSTVTTALSRPQTFGAQDQGIVASDSRVDIVRNVRNVSNLNEIDEGAVASAFDFARGAFSDATSTVEKSLALVGVTNEPLSTESIGAITGRPVTASMGKNLPLILVAVGGLFLFWKMGRR